MTILRLFIASLLCFISHCIYAQSCSPGPGPNGSGPRCAPNPVPCAHCTGTWTDNFGWVYNINSRDYPPGPGSWLVSGTLKAPASSCSVLYQNVSSGTLTQTSGGSGPATTTLNVTFSNPTPTGYCGNTHISATQTITATITNDDCANASGSRSNSDGSASNVPTSLTKPADIPTGGETTSTVSWDSQFPTIMLFQEGIPSPRSLAGRQVFEAGGAPSDTCWQKVPNSPYAHGDLSGGGWYVGYYYFDSSFHYDYVGMFPDAVKYYKGLAPNSVNVTPCLVTLPQTMKIYTPTGSQSYFSDTLYWNLPDQVNYGVAKNGVQAWRTYP